MDRGKKMRALADGVSNWAKKRKIRVKENGSPIQKGCDNKYQEDRGREIEDIVRITSSCDHLKCSTRKLMSRINLFTQLNQMQSGALICSWKEKHIKLSHTMIAYFSSCLSVLLDILCAV